MELQYQTGFGNDCSTEALPGALPVGRNSPQQCPYGLYAEQLSGTAFTAPRGENRRSWLYRIRPGAQHKPFEAFGGAAGWESTFGHGPVTPNQLRWSPMPIPDAPTDFLEGVKTWGGNGGPDEQGGVAIHMYAANRSMQGRYFYNADGELLLVPQQGRLRLATELGLIDLEPLEIAVIPRGVRFRVDLLDGTARGYMLENFGAALRLPELGPIGSNCLANARDFKTPVAWYEDVEGDFELVAKFTGGFWRASIDHSPLDVVAWHGTHAPYKYDLRHFNAIGSISYDHPDPSIFTVLTAPSDTPGTANMDFHMAIVELADSERLNQMFAPVLAELRLAFGFMKDAEFLHAPYVDMNQQILEIAEAGNYAKAADTLQDYLTHSERIVLAVYARSLSSEGLREN